MKHIFKNILTILFVSFLIVSCEDMLDVDSPRIIKESDNQLNSPNDSIYSMAGILAQLQNVAERYVLLGELRADLMDVTQFADQDLIELRNNDISVDNKYNNVKDYYNIINNCNYVIKNIDTSVIAKGQKALLKEFAAAKAIRAWTYMQIALNYGSVKYYTEPILSVDNINDNVPVYDFYNLALELVKDLDPWKDIEDPGFGMVGEFYSGYLFIPIRFILGDLYLWLAKDNDKGYFEKAAIEYHDLIYNEEARISHTYTSEREVNNGEFTGGITYTWQNSFNNSLEMICFIGTSYEYNRGSRLYNMTTGSTYSLTTSDVAVGNWATQIYYNDSVLQTFGDLRGHNGSYYDIEILYNESDQIGNIDISEYDNIILKYIPSFYENGERVILCRSSLLYLRYAEAVNRLGKPNTAFAVIKNGLTQMSLSDTTIIPKWEKSTPLDNYMDFTASFFIPTTRNRGNTGIHARGCGNIADVDSYKIPVLANLDDSIAYVEDLIQQELALETAFEGNRFQDLMRFALRTDNPETYMVDKISKKNPISGARLANKQNWYLPREE